MMTRGDEQSFRVALGVLEVVQDAGVRGVEAVLLLCGMAHLPERYVRTHLSGHLEEGRVAHDG